MTKLLAVGVAIGVSFFSFTTNRCLSRRSNRHRLA